VDSEDTIWLASYYNRNKIALVFIKRHINNITIWQFGILLKKVDMNPRALKAVKVTLAVEYKVSTMGIYLQKMRIIYQAMQ
jgi:hypothetical protein